MAAVFGKNVKIPNAQARCMLLLSGVKRSGPRLKKSFPLVYSNQNKFLSSAAQKLVVSDDFAQRRSVFPEPSRPNRGLSEDVDGALADIDAHVRRTGRVFRRSVERVFRTLRDAGSISSTQGLYLLRCCERMIDEAPEQRIRFADEVWQMMQNYGVQLEVAHHNSRLRLYVESGHPFSPGEVLAAMESQGVEPNKVTYRYLMEQCCADGNLSAASEILEFLKAKGIPVDENIFNALIKGYINSGDFDGAENILEVMKSSNLSPNADSHTALACGYARKGDLRRMRDHVRAQGGASLTDKHLLQVIDALAVSGRPEAIDEVMSAMGEGSAYRQDFINAAINLVHKSQDDVAFRLVLAASSPAFNVGTNLVLKQMLKSRRPVESIIEYSDVIFKKGLNDIILLNLARAAIDYEMMDYAIRLFEEMHKKGIPVREYYLTPIFSYYEQKKSPEGVLATLKKMSQFGILPDFTVYRHRVLPALGIVNAQDFVARLEQEKLPTSSALDALFDFYCSLGRSDLAANLLESNSVQVNPNFDLKGYISAFRKSDVDPMAYFKVLKFVIDNVGSYLLAQDQEAFQGRFLAELIRLDPALFDMFQKKMDCSLSQKSIKICREDLQKKAPQLLTHLRRLEKTEIDMSEEDEEKKLAALNEQGLPTKFFLVDRLMHHIKKRNIEKVGELRSRLEAQGFEFSPALCAQLIAVYAEAKDLDVVQDLVRKTKKVHPGFRLDIVKAVEYAALLVKYGKYDEAVESLGAALDEPEPVLNRTFLQRCLRRLFNSAAETGDARLARRLHDLFLPHVDTVVAKEVLLEMLVKVHAYKEDLAGALDEFRKCVQQHRLAPCLSLLLCKCILCNDQDTLQKVVNVTTSSFGEVTATSELAAALVETGRTDRASEVMETLRDRPNVSHVEDICRRMYNRNKVGALEQFIHITKGLRNLNRERMYHLLLSLHAEKNGVEQASRVLQAMREEGVAPGPETSRLVHDLYRLNDRDVPPELRDEAAAPREEEEGRRSLTSDYFKEKFMGFVREEDAPRALEELKRMKKGHVRSISTDELAQLVELLIRKKNLLELGPNVFVMSYLIEQASQVFPPLLRKYSESGDVESLRSVHDLLPDFSLRKMSFNYFYCKAFIASERYEDLISEMEKNMGNKNKVFSVSAFQELLKIPSVEERCLRLADKYMELSFDVPVAAVWAHFFVNENYEKAETILERHGVYFDKIDPTILRAIRKTENISMGKKYIEILESRPAVRQRTKERAYGTLLDILVLKEQWEEAASLASRGERGGLPLHKFYLSTLTTLKNALEREGKAVPFTLSSEDSPQAV